MLSEAENERLTRTGPGTPMGDVLRRYWLPAALSSEIPEVDCAPIRVKLLGESLVAYRDSDGNVGLLDERCPHRGASLWLGRNEVSGLRCVFHGWKFDRHGFCVDMPSETPETEFSAKVRVRAYPTVELGGLVWAYLGPPEERPPEPMFEWTRVPESHRHLSKTWEECNWLQALEGGVDSVHSSFLHRSLGGLVQKGGFSSTGYRARSGAPRLDVRETDWGFTYASVRPLGAEGDYVRTYQFVMPFHQIRAAQLSDGAGWRPLIGGHIWVPMDDHNCMVYNWFYHFDGQPLLDGEALDSNLGSGPNDVTADFRKVRNPGNDWLIDRRAQKTRTYTGIEGINTQDHAVQESMGPIVDRSQERLGSVDRAIIALRRVLLRSTDHVAGGAPLNGTGPSYYRVRAIERLLPTGAAWWEVLHQELFDGYAAPATR